MLTQAQYKMMAENAIEVSVTVHFLGTTLIVLGLTRIAFALWYCGLRKFHQRLIFAYFANRFSVVKIKLVKFYFLLYIYISGYTSQWKLIFIEKEELAWPISDNLS